MHDLKKWRNLEDAAYTPADTVYIPYGLGRIVAGGHWRVITISAYSNAQPSRKDDRQPTNGYCPVGIGGKTQRGPACPHWFTTY